MRKLLLFILCLLLLVGCSKNENIEYVEEEEKETIVEDIPVSTESDIVTTKKEETVTKRIFEEFSCNMNEAEFYYCWSDEKDEDGHTVVYHEGYPIEKKVFDNGFVLYYDEEHPELGYTALHTYGGFAIMYNDYTLTTYTTDNYETYTIFFDPQWGEVITIIKGQYVFFEVDGMLSTMWFGVYDEHCKLISGDSLEWYDEYYVEIPQGPALQYSYQLGNGKYLSAYKEIDGTRVNYILDMNGSVVLEDSTAELGVGKGHEYVLRIENGKYGLMNLASEIVLPVEYDALEIHANGIVAIKENKLYVYSSLLTPLINGEYELPEKEYMRYLCCDNYNNFTAYDSEAGLVVITIDTDYLSGRVEDETLEINPNYTHQFLISGKTITEMEYEFEY